MELDKSKTIYKCIASGVIATHILDMGIPSVYHFRSAISQGNHVNSVRSFILAELLSSSLNSAIENICYSVKHKNSKQYIF